jgi:hydrogenase small subunit
MRMSVNRRDFLKMAGVMGSTTVFEICAGELQSVFAQAAASKHVIWLQAAGDSGCTISFLQSASPDLVDVIANFRLSVDFQPTIMIPSGETALAALEKAGAGTVPLDILIVEGAVPSGGFCTVGEAAGRLGAKAKSVVAVGTCASFGGISAARPNPTGCRPVSAVLPGKRVVNIPGCPAHPDWVILTLANILNGRPPSLDSRGRPTAFFSEDVHEECPLEESYEENRAGTFAKPGCLFNLGCKGKITKADCPTRLWNNKTSFCIAGPRRYGFELYRAGAPCIGCTEPGFPDPPFAPFYKALPGGGDDDD